MAYGLDADLIGELLRTIVIAVFLGFFGALVLYCMRKFNVHSFGQIGDVNIEVLGIRQLQQTSVYVLKIKSRVIVVAENNSKVSLIDIWDENSGSNAPSPKKNVSLGDRVEVVDLMFK